VFAARGRVPTVAERLDLVNAVDQEALDVGDQLPSETLVRLDLGDNEPVGF
jgi:hypothetical protein